MTQTTIEWVRNKDGSIGHTVNPIRARSRRDRSQVGHFCEKISPGCANCYASRYQSRVHLYEFLPANRKRVDIFLDAEKLRDVLARQAPTTYFWCDMTDMFGEWVSGAWLDAIVATIAATSDRHTHMLLTKRAGRQRTYFRDLSLLTPLRRKARLLEALTIIPRSWPKATTLHEAKFTTWPIANLRVGVSIENQLTADERLPELARTPAWDRYISYEPALGPVTLKMALCSCPNKPASFQTGHIASCVLHKHAIGDLITRIIVGGESGPGARPNYLGWTKSAIRQAAEFHMALFNKQLGAFPTFTPIGTREFEASPIKPVRVKLAAKKGNDPAEWPDTAPDGRGGLQPINLKVREWPE